MALFLRHRDMFSEEPRGLTCTPEVTMQGDFGCWALGEADPCGPGTVPGTSNRRCGQENQGGERFTCCARDIF